MQAHPNDEYAARVENRRGKTEMWYILDAEPVLWAAEKGITNGVDATHFTPASTCTRGQVATFLYRTGNK